MRLLRLFISFYIGLTLNFVFVFFFGEAGWSRYEELTHHRLMLADNIVDLEKINWRLNQELLTLGTDPEKIKLLARDLGYFAPGDNVVWFEQFPDKKSLYTVGKLIEVIPVKDKNLTYFFRIFNIFLPLLFYVISGLIWREKTRDYQGIRS